MLECHTIMLRNRAVQTTVQTREQASASARLLAAGSVLGAALASSCCIVPLVLVMLGVSGAWIGSLTALEAYKPYFLVVTALFLAAGFRRVYFTERPECADGSYCARPASTRLTKAALWLGAILAVFAGTVNWWAALLY